MSDVMRSRSRTCSTTPSLARWKVALVGRRLTDNENLGLGYLAAALTEAGFGWRRFDLNQAHDVSKLGQEVLRGEFELVGLSIPDGGSAYLPLAFGEFLQRQGYAKPITCGGSFATLARQWLLERCAWLHSVVRFAGEVPLVQLAQALREGRDVHQIPGLTTRAGDGIPAPVLDSTPLTLWPTHDELPAVLGHPAANILATRGCAGRCGYCAPAALQMQEQKEGRLAGVRPELLRSAGVGYVRRRAVDDLCDEMAHLWQEHGVRYFYFVDEHLLPYGEDEALDFLARLGRGLGRRRVGKLGIGTMLRADRLTEKVVRAFAEVGLVRAFVGIELPSVAEGRRFGRPFDGQHARAILAACEAAGVAVVSNVMMVHPYSTPETIAGAIAFLESVPAGVFEATQMRVYHGTTLWHRMAKEGRLIGNPLRYSYRFSDPVVAHFDEIFMRLRAEAFWNHSIAYRTHDGFLAHTLGRRLRPDLGLGAISSEMGAIRDQVVELYVGAYRKALGLAVSGVGGVGADLLIAEARAAACRLQERLDACVHDLARRLDTSPRIFSPTRAAAAGAIAFTFLGGPLSACGRSAIHSPAVDATTPADVADATPTLVADARTTEAGQEVVLCTEAMRTEQERQYQEKVAQAASCFSGYLHFPGDAPPSAVFEIPPPGGPYVGGLCRTSADATDFDAQVSEWEAAAQGAAATELGHSCLARSRGGQEVDINGGAGQQADQIWQAFVDCANKTGDYPSLLHIVIDRDGRVAAISATSEELSSCLLAALDGLVFPCLAGAEICEDVFIE